MRKMLPLFTLGLFLLSVVGVRAYYDQAVLGTSTRVSDAVFPPVTAGPGHILPDSPFYALDKLYQTLRLALVFTPENRAQLHTQIASERLAELRVEVMRNNQTGIDTALTELQHESMAAAEDIRDAASQGKDVTQLARNIHQALADNRQILMKVQSQVPETSFSQKLAATTDVLRDARVISEDALPQSDLDHEIAANVDTEVNEAVLGVQTSIDALQKRMTIQQSMASKAAEREMQKQQINTIKETTKASQAAIIEQRKKAIQDYLTKVQALRKQREQELEQLKKTIKDLQDQLKQLQQQEHTDIKNIRTGTTPTPKPSPTITSTLKTTTNRK